MSESKTEAGKKSQVSIGLPDLTLFKIDKLRGDIPRSAYLRKRIIAMFEKDPETAV